MKRKFAVPYNDGGVSVARDLDVISYYSIPADKEYAYMFDTVTNNGVAFSTESANEVSLSNKGGDGIDTKTVAALAPQTRTTGSPTQPATRHGRSRRP